MNPQALTGAGNVTTNQGTSGSTLTSNRPANTADGDLLWVALYHRNASGSFSAPAGWTVHKTEPGNGTFAFATKPIPTASSEPASYSFSFTGGSNRWMIAIGRIIHADLDAPLDVAGVTSVFTGTTSLVHPSLNAAADDCLLLAISTNNTGAATIAAFTADGAMTQVAQVGVSTGSATSNLQVAQQPLTAPGATGTRTATMSPAAANSGGFLVTIAPGGLDVAGGGSISGAATMTAAGAADADGDATIAGTATLSAAGAADTSGGSAVTGLLSMTAAGVADTGIGLSPRPRTRWLFMLGPRTGGYQYALPKARSRRMAFKLEEPDELSFTIDGRYLPAGALRELATDVHVLYLGPDDVPRPLSRMRVGATGDDWDEAGKGDVSVTGLDYRAILNVRRLWSNSQLAWVGVDQAEIAWQLIQQTQQRVAGDLGIFKAWSGASPTGVPLDRTYEAGDAIGERITELAERVGGFDWDLVPVSESALQLEVWPERGTNRGVVLETGGLVAKGRREFNPSSYANTLRYTGSTDPVTTPVELEAPDLADAPEGRWEAVFGDDGLTLQSQLQDRADWQLANSQAPQPVYTLTLKPGKWKGPSHIWLGDPVRVVPRRGRLRDVDVVLRVHEIAITLGESGQETVEVTVGGRRPDYRRRPTEFERRLANLERR